MVSEVLQNIIGHPVEELNSVCAVHGVKEKFHTFLPFTGCFILLHTPYDKHVIKWHF